MEEDVLRADGGLEDGVDGGDRSAEVLEIERDGDVDKRRVADGGSSDGFGAAFVGIAECAGFSEGEAIGMIGGGAREAEVAVEMGGSDRFSRGEGVDGGA